MQKGTYVGQVMAPLDNPLVSIITISNVENADKNVEKNATIEKTFWSVVVRGETR